MKILITDILLRKTFDIINIIKSAHKEYMPVLCESSGSLFAKSFARILYASEIYTLRKSCLAVFEQDLRRILNEHKDEKVVFLPVEEDTTRLLLEFLSRNSFPNLYCNLPEKRPFNIARNKKRVAEFCRRYGIPVPQEFSEGDIPRLKKKFRPVVAKPQTGTGAEGLIYIDSPRQLPILENMDLSDYVVQERIGNLNEVLGGFFLFDRGKLISFYSHKRIRTYPPSGGVSVYSRLDCHQRIKELGKSLLERLHWSGLAMIEFIHDKHTDDYKVIEVNPRLWGSFMLSEFSGADFLRKFVATSLGNPVSKSGRIRKDVYIRWFFPFDLINYFLSLGRIKYFWAFNTQDTCYINFTYSQVIRSLLFLSYLNVFYLVELFKKVFKL